MDKSVRIENIFSQITKLDYESRLSLIERIVQQLIKTKPNTELKKHSLLELNSLGSEIWKNVDIDKFVERERKWD